MRSLSVHEVDGIHWSLPFRVLDVDPAWAARWVGAGACITRTLPTLPLPGSVAPVVVSAEPAATRSKDRYRVRFESRLPLILDTDDRLDAACYALEEVYGAGSICEANALETLYGWARRGGYVRPRPASRARTIASARSATWSLAKTLETLLRTVFGER